MSHRGLKTLVALVLGLLNVNLDAQSVPTTINYQGRVTDNTPQQNPISGSSQFVFALYDAPAGGNKLWEEPSSGAIPVMVNGGIFNVLLGGNGVPLPASVFSGGASRYLQVTFNGETLAPRQVLAATGYANQAENANLAISALASTTALNALNLGGQPAANYLLTSGTAYDSARLGGTLAGGWQKALLTPACAAPQVFSAINADGSSLCVTPQSTLSLPLSLGGTTSSTGLSVQNDGTGAIASFVNANSAATQDGVQIMAYGQGSGLTVQGFNTPVSRYALEVTTFGSGGAVSLLSGGSGNAATLSVLSTINNDALSVTASSGRAAFFNGRVAVMGQISASSFSGSGVGLSNLNAAALTGTVPIASVPAAVLRTGDNVSRLVNDAGYLTQTTADARYSRLMTSPRQLATLRWYGANQGLAAVPGGGSPWLAACDGENVWVTNISNNVVTKIRTLDSVVLGNFPTGPSPIGLVYDGANMWVSIYGTNTIARIRISDGMILASTPVGSGPIWLAYDGAYIWSANNVGNSISKVRALDGVFIGTYPVGTAPISIAFDGGNLWVTNSGNNTVSKVNPANGAVLGTYPVGSSPRAVVFDGTYIWTSNLNSNNVTRLLAIDGSAAGTFAVGTQPRGMVFDGSAIWVANNFDNTVTRLRASDGAVLGTYPTGAGPFGLTFDGSAVWVANNNANTVSRF